VGPKNGIYAYVIDGQICTMLSRKKILVFVAPCGSCCFLFYIFNGCQGHFIATEKLTVVRYSGWIQSICMPYLCGSVEMFMNTLVFVRIFGHTKTQLSRASFVTPYVTMLLPYI